MRRDTTAPASARLRPLRRGELLALLSFTMALSALSIDLMLPAFGEIRTAFELPTGSSDTAAIVTVFMIGLAGAQMFYGPLADHFGRKPVLFAGFGLYALGALGAALAPSFGLLLASRLLWGIGSAGPRVITLAIVRDTYQGDRMARAMSFIMAVFILVPVLAPSVGAALVAIAPWRSVFWFCVVYVGAIAVWAIRLPETLDPESRLDLRFGRIFQAARSVVSHRQTMACVAAITVLFGAFISYVATSELIIDDVFGLADRFPLIFGGLAVLMGMANLANASLVEKLGARRMIPWMLLAYVIGAGVLLTVSLGAGGTPPFWAFVPPLALVLVMNAFLVPNLNTLAMEPMGRVAGTASALIGTAQTAGGAVLGSLIDRAYQGTVTPLAVGFLVAGVTGFALVNLGYRAAPADRGGT